MGSLARDLGDYGKRLAKQPYGFVPGVGGLVLTVATGATGRPFSQAPAATVGLALVGFVVAAFLDWRASREMDETHAQRLKCVAMSLYDTIAAGGACVYSDGKRADLHHKTDFQRHFPELTERLEEWAAFGARERRAEELAKQSIYKAGWKRWTPEPGLSAGPVAQYGFDYVARNLELDPPQIPQFDVNPNAIVQGTSGGGTIVRFLSEHPNEQEVLAAQEEAARLRDWVTEMYESAPSREWRALLARKLEVQRQLCGNLQEIMHAPKLLGRRCGPECEPR